MLRLWLVLVLVVPLVGVSRLLLWFRRSLVLQGQFVEWVDLLRG